jgi:hypothetical protein
MKMVATDIFVKTGLGLQEVSSRKLKLPNRLRCMFILIDGVQPVATLKDEAQQLGAPPDFLEQLEALQLIARKGAASAVSNVTVGMMPGTEVDKGDEFSRFRVAKDLMNATIVDALGIKSFFFTLKLEKASTRADLAQLVPDYQKAMAKAMGPESAQVMVDRLKRMLS